MITVTYKPQDDIWFCPSKMLLESQSDEEVLAAFDQEIQIRPNQHRVWYFRGLILSKLRRNDEAIVSLDCALQIQPMHSQAWHNRGLVLLQLKRYEEAIASFDRAIQIRSDTKSGLTTPFIRKDNLLDMRSQKPDELKLCWQTRVKVRDCQ